MPRLAAIALLVFVPMLFETWLAARNARAQRARGGVEPAGDVYAIMRLAYPCAFLAMLLEGAWRGPASPGVVTAGVAIFVAAKAIKAWAIAALGPRWTFRVIVVPGLPLVATGPYRFLRHPNYVGVLGELAGVALMTRAIVAGPAGVLAFIWLLHERIAVEERALDLTSQGRII